MANKGHDNVIGKGFDARPENINRKGRPKRTVNMVLDELKSQGYKTLTPVDVKDVYMSLLDCTQDELTAYVNNKEVSMLVRTVARAMLDKRGFDIIEKMLDRSMGKPVQGIHQDITSNGQTLGVVFLPQKTNELGTNANTDQSTPTN
jgi:hypothetical protein